MSRHKMLHCNIIVKRRGPCRIAAIAIAAMVASCAWFEGDPPPAAEGDTDYPNLAEVPERPDLSTMTDSAALEEGLRSDRANARYNEAPLKSSTAAGAKPPPPTPVQIANVSATETIVETPNFVETEVAVTAAEVQATAPVQGTGATVQVPANTAAVEPGPMIAGSVSPIVTAPPPPAPVQTTETSITAPPPAPVAIATPTAPAVGTPTAPATTTQTAAIPASPPMPTQTPSAAPVLTLTPPPPSSGTASVVVYPIDSQGAPPSGVPLPATVIYFGNNSSSVTPSEMEKIRQIAQARAARQARVRLIGHASMRTGDMRSVEHDRANLEISWLRANAVADALRRQGVPIEVMVVTAVADTQPVYMENMPAGEAGNRRVEIYLE
ncbi:MAG: OmpA family protein [Alphaproteobacteria bacterium]|nr:OmpA family protein [Alphaproteobacteria bacterium]